jgi:ABC-type branched-subunit amino acid transport system ATPase component
LLANLASIKAAMIPKRKAERDFDHRRLLEVRDVSMSFGMLTVLKGVTFSVPRGNILVMIGPNGAGKSTLLKLISGLLPVQKGEIWFRQRRLNGIAPHDIASLGITQLFQDIQLFSNMSIVENVMVGCHLRSKTALVSYGLKLARARDDERHIYRTAMRQLSLVGLKDRALSRPASLSWGQQKLVGIARALATGSELLLLDEPYSGLHTEEIDKLNQLILGLQLKGITIVIVEHLTDMLMGIANQVIVLDHGEKIAEGTPSEIQRNKQVIDAYLGDDRLNSESG